MKRALVVLLAFVGFSAFGIGTFSGKWSFTYCPVSSSPGIKANSLTINYTDFGWTFTNTFDLYYNGFYTKASGAFGPFSLNGEMWFNPITPAYMGARLATTLDFGGLSFGFKVLHWNTTYNSNMFDPGDGWPWGPFYEEDILETSPCQANYGMLYILTSKVDPVELRISFVDCCEGIEFNDVYLWLKGIGLCCGVALDAEFHFTKAGFESISFTGLNIPLCCGVSLDVGVTFTTDAKTVSIEPKFGGLGEACFEIWGDATYEDHTWTGIELYGFRIKCTLGDCNFVEIVEAFNPGWVNTYILPSADDFNTDCGENEYVKLGLCGPGCCGGKYSATLWFYFGKGALFDLTRIKASLSVPVMTNFTLSLSMNYFLANCSTTSVCLGWTFSF